ncbi:hypothetical protein TWF694_006505 [Orbilia ellipsospora]|uniref:Uncharacterized protein n=1 Tax=Orbilia ellipsospora TaxID=2528407 RepID=A0AAV9XNQ9_9PEZI
MMENDPKSPGTSPLTFETLPPEIRNQIYGYLLHIKHCDKSYNFAAILKYHLHPNILRTSKKIYREAHGILYGSSGPVITVALYDSYAASSLQEGLVSYFTTRYTRSIAGRQLHIVVRPTFCPPNERKALAIVLVGLDDIRWFSRYLRFSNWGRNDGRGISYEFNFESYGNALNEIEPSQDEAVNELQHTLVCYFSHLASVQTCTTKGLISKPLEISFLERMNDTTIWLRVEILEYVHFSLMVYNDAFKYWLKGMMDQAIVRYDFLQFLWADTQRANPLLRLPSRPDDHALYIDLTKLIIATKYCRMLAVILCHYHKLFKCQVNIDRYSKEALEKIMCHAVEVAGTIEAFDHFHMKDTASCFWHLAAVIRVVLKRPILETSRCLALAVNSSDETTKELKVQSYRLVMDAIESETRLKKATVKKIVGSILPLPFPFSIKFMHKNTTVLTERYILQKLNYKGRLYETLILPLVIEKTDPDTGEEETVGDKVDKRLCRKVLMNMEKERADSCNSEVTAWIDSDTFHFKGSCKHMRDDGTPGHGAISFPFGPAAQVQVQMQMTML